METFHYNFTQCVCIGHSSIGHTLSLDILWTLGCIVQPSLCLLCWWKYLTQYNNLVMQYHYTWDVAITILRLPYSIDLNDRYVV